MELAERITARAAELASEAEALRKQLADTEHELERLAIAGQVITQLTADDADDPVPGPAPAQRGFGLLVPPRSQVSGPADLPQDYRQLLEAVAAAVTEAGGPVSCVQAARQAGLDISGRRPENIRARLRRLEDRGWLRRTAAGTFTLAP